MNHVSSSTAALALREKSDSGGTDVIAWAISVEEKNAELESRGVRARKGLHGSNAVGLRMDDDVNRHAGGAVRSCL